MALPQALRRPQAAHGPPGAQIRPCRAALLTPRTPFAPAAARAPRRTAARAQANSRSSLDERLTQRLAALEASYATPSVAHPPLAATAYRFAEASAASQQPPQQQPDPQQQQPEQQPEQPSSPRSKQAATEVCGASAGVHLCVERISDDGEQAPAPPVGALGRLLDSIPLSKRAKGIVMLNLLVLLVATNWVVVKDVGGSFDPYGFAFLRFAVAALAFSPFLKSAAADRRIIWAGAELGVWTGLGYITQSAGLLTTDASRASFLSTFTVLVVPLLAGLSGKGVSAVTWAACCAALVGVGLLEQGGAPAGIGDVWSLLSALAFGVQMFRTEHHARRLGGTQMLPLMSVVLATTMACAGLAAAAAHPAAVADMLAHGVDVGAVAGQGLPWAQVLYCGLLTTDLALLLELLALQSVSSVDAALIYTLEPVLGAALAWLVLGESMGPKGLAGAGIILASSVATQIFGGGNDDAEGGEAAAAEQQAQAQQQPAPLLAAVEGSGDKSSSGEGF